MSDGIGATAHSDLESVSARRTTTMNDVARLAGVSLKTVSNVINHYPHIRPETRRRVQEAITALGYRVNTTARNLRLGRTGLIGLALPDLGESYFGELANAVVDEADSRGLSVLIEPTRADAASELAVLTNDRRSMTDGLIFSPLLLEAAQLRAAASPRTVLLGERIFGVGLDHVTLANIEGSYTATMHLIRRGARRIAAVGAQTELDQRLENIIDDRPVDELTTTSEYLRAEGYRRALADAGLTLDRDLLLPTGPWRRASGAKAITDALERGLRFDAVFGLNDAVALGAMHALLVRGITVPDSVQVVGFDDLDESSYATPALTTVSPGRADVARAAVDMLIDRLEGSADPTRLLAVPATLIERDSTR